MNLSFSQIYPNPYLFFFKNLHLLQLRDIEEGADFVIIKPSMCYLDIVKEVSTLNNSVPVAAYQTSGEYCMLWYAGKAGAIDHVRAVFESLNCITRAGANIIITYYAPTVLEHLSRKEH